MLVSGVIKTVVSRERQQVGERVVLVCLGWHWGICVCRFLKYKMKKLVHNIITYFFFFF